MQNNHDKVHNIIKYDPCREYFGPWSPRQLQTIFRKIYKNPFRPLAFIDTGHLSVEIICDTLWNEMSYNPGRFGYKNPFENKDVLSIKYFIQNHIHDANQDDIMPKIARKLDYFLYIIGKSNPEFIKFGKIYGFSILIDCDRYRKSGYGYRALAALGACIHFIASQNIDDYRLRKYHDQIHQIATTRHPNLQRSNKHVNFVQIEKLKKQKAHAYAAIADKTSEIFDTESRIEILNGYEPPVDTSYDQILLSQQESELQVLEKEYATIKNMYDQQILQSQEIEK